MNSAIERLATVLTGNEETYADRIHPSARIFIEQALGDEAKRAQLGEPLAARCQDLLDQRARNVFRAVSTLWAKAGSAVRCCYFGESWWNWPPIIGSHWFASSDWQAETARLYEAAAEVAEKLRDSPGEASDTSVTRQAIAQ